MAKHEVSIGRMRRQLYLLSILKIPVIGFVRPRLLSIDENTVRMRIRLRRRTKNHLNSMYFGALAVGADVAAGIHSFYFAALTGRKVIFAFKGMKGDFLMRAESDVTFVCEEGAKIKAAMDEAYEAQERINLPVEVLAYNTNGEKVAIFEMVLSVRVKD